MYGVRFRESELTTTRSTSKTANLNKFTLKIDESLGNMDRLA